jgi:hypothetical protein
MANPQDEAFLNFLKEFENLWPEILANISLKQQQEKWVKLLKEYCIELQAKNHGVAVEPNLSIFQRFRELSPINQHYWTDRCRYDCKKILQEQTGVFLQVCSWNPNADGLLTAQDLQKCLYGTLGVMAPDILCLQETIWEPNNFLKKLKEGQPDDKHFIFSGKMATFQHSSQEAAILYNPEKFEVDNQVAVAVNAAWRVQVQRLEDRTVALQGKIVSTNRDIIIITIRMFSDDQRATLSTEIIFQAQELANERNTTVILCCDWNCQVNLINLPKGACP